jgi:hypothetical protein
MVTTKPTTHLTYEDYLETPDDERWELLKRKLYAEHGVKEYWLVDPDAMTVTILLLGERTSRRRASTAFEEAGVYRGELHMAPSPSMPHQIVNTRLGSRLLAFVEDRDLGKVITAPADVALSTKARP